MSRNDVNDWGRRLDSGERDDALHALAVRLAANRSPSPHPSSGFKSELRARLLGQSIARRPMQWAMSLAVAGLLVVIAGLLWWTTHGPSSVSPAALQDESTPVPTPLADWPSPTPVPTESVDRLVFNHSPQALFGENANQSGKWRGYQDIFVSDLDGRNVTALLDGPDQVNHFISFSPNGRKMLIAANPLHITPEGEKYTDLYVMDVDGSNVIKLASDSRYLTNPTAYWLSDSRIVFVARADETQAVFVINADGTGLLRLTDTSARPLWLVPSPDTTRVYWQEGTLATYDYTVGGYRWMALDGSETEHIWEGMNATQVKISPAGDKIAYQRRDCGFPTDDSSTCYAFFMADLDGANEKQVTWAEYPDSAKVTDHQPFMWSPDGQYLLVDVFVKTDAGYGQLFYLWSPSDSSVVQLSAAIEVWSSDSWPVGPPPQWSPDGHRILFENFTWPLPKILNLDTMEVSEALTALRPKPGITGPWYVTWLPPQK